MRIPIDEAPALLAELVWAHLDFTGTPNKLFKVLDHFLIPTAGANI
jgi:hypothetical protein